MDTKDLQKFNDEVYGRCPYCHKDLSPVMRTDNNWFQRLLGADNMGVYICFDHDFVRMNKKNNKGSSRVTFDIKATYDKLKISNSYY